jgi:Alginate export
MGRNFTIAMLCMVCAATVALRAEAAEESITSSHNLRLGAITANTFYQDKTITKGLFSGFYRPYLKYTFDRRFETLVRGNLTVKRYIEAPSNGTQQTSVSGAMEIFSVDATFGNHRINLGRNFFMTEQGILFANFADGAAYTGTFSFGTLRGMALYSADYGSKNCALSVTGCAGDTNAFVSTPTLSADSGVQNSGQRVFGVVDYTSPVFLGGQLSLYSLVSKDLISEATSNTTRYEYNPYYAGIGLLGYIYNANYRYRVDAIYQGGNAFNAVSNGVSTATTIQAYAVIANFSWTLPVLKRIDSQFVTDFAMGSGDEDSTSVSTPSQSNNSGNYNAFQAYGSFSAGLALKPRLTNMTIYRAGFQMRPLKFIHALRNLGSQVKYSLYRKTKAKGGISDTYATEDNADVGQGLDVALTYGIFTDVQFFYGFGVFKPGAAYPGTNSDGSSGSDLRMAHLVSLTVVF